MANRHMKRYSTTSQTTPSLKPAVSSTRLCLLAGYETLGSGSGCPAERHGERGASPGLAGRNLKGEHPAHPRSCPGAQQLAVVTNVLDSGDLVVVLL